LRLRSTVTEARPTNLELFFDLVFVVVIARMSDLIQTDPAPKVFVEYFGLFAIVFFTWVGFTTYADRFDVDDTVHRLIVLGAALANIVVAIHVDDAFTSGSEPFALATIATRACLLAVTDRSRRKVPEAAAFQGYYEIRWALGLAVWIVSLFVPTPWRYVVWGIALAIEIGTPLLSVVRIPTLPLVSSHIAERFGLFTIIVLGEVILGVVAGLSAAGPDALTIATGSLALVIGFGLWWIYFDLVGRRLPRPGGPIWTWMLSHLPIQLSIVGAGAAIVSLIEHAHEPTTPPATALLLGGSVALGPLALIVTERSLEDAVRLESVYRPMGAVLALGAVIALLAGWLAPAPWILAGLLVAILTALWFFVVVRMIRAGVWGETLVPAAEAADVSPG
jgi:low temperature requirement protein LtrA